MVIFHSYASLPEGMYEYVPFDGIAMFSIDDNPDPTKAEPCELCWFVISPESIRFTKWYQST